MTNLKDKAIRHLLIERYLDADTSVEEEKAMADFYRHCDESELTDEELDIRNMMLGLEHESAKMQKSNKSSHQDKWVRFSAITLAAAMLAGLIFLIFPITDRVAKKPNFAALAPTTQVIRSLQKLDDNDDLSPMEQMERQDSLFLVATKNIVTPTVAKKVSYQKTRVMLVKKNHSEVTCQEHQPEVKTRVHPSEAKSIATDDDIHQLYEIASLALPTAEELKLDKQGSDIVISTKDEKGNLQHFTVDVDDAQEGIYQFHPLAQLNNMDN